MKRCRILIAAIFIVVSCGPYKVEHSGSAEVKHIITIDDEKLRKYFGIKCDEELNPDRLSPAPYISSDLELCIDDKIADFLTAIGA